MPTSNNSTRNSRKSNSRSKGGRLQGSTTSKPRQPRLSVRTEGTEQPYEMYLREGANGQVLTTVYLEMLPGCCGAGVISGVGALTTPAKVKAVTAAAHKKYSCVQATVNNNQAGRGVLDAFEGAGYKRVTEFTNKNSGNDVYVLMHVA